MRAAKSHPTSWFGRRLRDVRLRENIPQDKLGVAIGLDEGTASARISRYESGKHAAPYDIAVRLAEILKVPTSYFYCDDDELARVIEGWGKMTKREKLQILALIESFK